MKVIYHWNVNDIWLSLHPINKYALNFQFLPIFFLTVHYTRNIHLLTAITKGGKCRENPCFIGLFFRAGILYPPPPLSPLKSIWCLKGKRTVKARSRDADLVIFSADPDVSFHFWQSSRSRYPNRKQRNHLSHQLYLKYKLVYCLYRHCISC